MIATTSRRWTASELPGRDARTAGGATDGLTARTDRNRAGVLARPRWWAKGGVVGLAGDQEGPRITASVEPRGEADRLECSARDTPGRAEAVSGVLPPTAVDMTPEGRSLAAGTLSRERAATPPAGRNPTAHLDVTDSATTPRWKRSWLRIAGPR